MNGEMSQMQMIQPLNLTGKLQQYSRQTITKKQNIR